MSELIQLQELIESVDNREYRQAAIHALKYGQFLKLFSLTMGAKMYCTDSEERAKLVDIAFITPITI